MKKTIAVIIALAMVLVLAAGALADEAAAPALTGGTQFNMDMDQVMQIINRQNYEIDQERTRGPVEFYELEYEDYSGAEGFISDVKFLFVGNSLVAIHIDPADHVSYDQVKTYFTTTYGPAVPFDAAKLGNGKYAVDDDGDLKDCAEMIVSDGILIILEKDRDGDAEVTILDPTAAYINN